MVAHGQLHRRQGLGSLRVRVSLSLLRPVRGWGPTRSPASPASPAGPSAEAARPVTSVRRAFHARRREVPGDSLPARQARLGTLPVTALGTVLTPRTFTSPSLGRSMAPGRRGPGPRGSSGSRPVRPPPLPLSWSVLVLLTRLVVRMFLQTGLSGGPTIRVLQGHISSGYAHARARQAREAPAIPLDSWVHSRQQLTFCTGSPGFCDTGPHTEQLKLPRISRFRRLEVQARGPGRAAGGRAAFPPGPHPPRLFP